MEEEEEKQQKTAQFKAWMIALGEELGCDLGVLPVTGRATGGRLVSVNTF